MMINDCWWKLIVIIVTETDAMMEMRIIMIMIIDNWKLVMIMVITVINKKKEI